MNEKLYNEIIEILNKSEIGVDNVKDNIEYNEEEMKKAIENMEEESKMLDFIDNLDLRNIVKIGKALDEE